MYRDDPLRVDKCRLKSYYCTWLELGNKMLFQENEENVIFQISRTKYKVLLYIKRLYKIRYAYNLF